MPGWFRALFTAVMLLFCITMCHLTVERASILNQVADLEQKLETSRGRERKQTAEYEAVTARLPEVQAELARVLPLAEEKKAEETILREERKRLRQEIQELKEKNAVFSASQERMAEAEEAAGALLRELTEE